jgi:anaerobic selenocysteine-containing dehydrogenase
MRRPSTWLPAPRHCARPDGRDRGLGVPDDGRGVPLSEIAERSAAPASSFPAKSDIPDDGKLVSTDRFPNRRGLVALGFEEAASLGEPCDGMIVARCDPAADSAEWRAALENALAVVVVGDRVGESASYADHLLAIASHFEAEGSFVNRQGRLQSYAPAVPPPGSAVPGWQALAAVLVARRTPLLDATGRSRRHARPPASGKHAITTASPS